MPSYHAVIRPYDEAVSIRLDRLQVASVVQGVLLDIIMKDVSSLAQGCKDISKNRSAYTTGKFYN